jgi:hypothetical protein
MKFLKVLAILLFGPLLGIVVAFVLGSLALRPDPNFVANGGHVSPGDGFLILAYLFISLLVSVPLSFVLAGVVLFRKPKDQRQTARP